MPPHDGLTHLKEYDIKDSNVELIGSKIDHSVKYASAATEPAWNDGVVGHRAGLFVWRIEDFEVIPWPQEKVGQFYDGDSYIVLHSYEIGKEGSKKLAHEISFWLGSTTTQDEAGTAAYKTVELDEFLRGVACQYREVQSAPSEAFLALFPVLRILKGGVRSGCRHVEQEEEKEEVKTLLRILKPASGKNSIMVHEVEPTWQSLDEDDVFVLDTGIKIWVWQGKKCSPMEKAKAAQVVHDMTLAKHIDVEVLSQTDSRSVLVVNLLGGEGERDFQCPKPSSIGNQVTARPVRLFRLSDASGQLSFDLVKDGQSIRKSDFSSNDVFVLDTGKAVWVWRGLGASQAEKSMWIKVAQMYVNHLQIHLTPIASVVEGNESLAFLKAIDT